MWQQAGGLTDGTRLEAATAAGLPRVALAKPSPTQIIPLPPTRSPHPPPCSLPGDSHQALAPLEVTSGHGALIPSSRIDSRQKIY